MSVFIQAGPFISPKSTDGLTRLDNGGIINHTGSRTGAVDEIILTTGKAFHAVLQISTVQGGGPLEPVILHNPGGHAQINTTITDFAVIHPKRVTADISGDTSFKQRICSTLIEIVHTEIQPPVEQGELQTQVELLGLLPRKLGSRYVICPITGKITVGSKIVCSSTHKAHGRVRTDGLATHNTITGAKFNVLNRGNILHEILIAQRPSCGNRRKVPPFLFGKARRTVGTKCSGKHITILKIVHDTGHSRHQRPLLVTIVCITRGSHTHIPPAHTLGQQVVTGYTHCPGFGGGHLIYSRGCQMMVIPGTCICQIVGALQHQTISIVIAHTTLGPHSFGAETITFPVIIVYAIGCGECQPLHYIKAQINTSVENIGHCLSRLQL